MYKWYTMYMMYTVADFRKNMRAAFEAAAQGEEVKIERYETVFTLVSENLAKKLQKVQTKPVLAKEGELVDIKLPVYRETPIAFCKHNAVKGLCKKGCK